MYEYYGLPGCDAVYFGRYVPPFQINPLFPQSVDICSVLKKEAACSSKPLTYGPNHIVSQANRTLHNQLCQSSKQCQFKPTNTDKQFIDAHTNHKDDVYAQHRTLYPGCTCRYVIILQKGKRRKVRERDSGHVPSTA